MSFASIRSTIERRLNKVYAEMTPPIPVVFDNVQEDPIVSANGEYVTVAITWPQSTVGVVCFERNFVEYVNGTLSVFCYTPRGIGMKRLEEMAAVAICEMDQMCRIPGTTTPGDYDNAALICEDQPGGPWGESDMVNDQNLSICMDAPSYNSPPWAAGTGDFDNANGTPRSDIIDDRGQYDYVPIYFTNCAGPGVVTTADENPLALAVLTAGFRVGLN